MGEMIRWNVHDHHIDIFCSWYVVDIAEVNNKSSHGAIRRQRDMLLAQRRSFSPVRAPKKTKPKVLL